MFQYADSFVCALNGDNNSIVVHFNQKVPYVNETQNGEFEVTTGSENVVSLMLSPQCAHDLARVINNIYEATSTTHDNENGN